MKTVVIAKKRRVFYGWFIVLSGAATMMYSSGIFFYGFTNFFSPIATEFGWSYAATSLAFSLQRLQGGIAAPLIGYLTDRLGSRFVMAGGYAIMAVGFVLMGHVDSLAAFYVTFLIASFGSSSGGGSVGMVTVSAWFNRNRGKAIGLLMFGPGFSGLFAPLLVWMISAYGWRNSLVVAGIGMMLFCVPLTTLIFRNDPKQFGLLPDGDSPGSSEDMSRVGVRPASRQQAQSTDNAGLDLGQALRTRSFWLMTLALSLAQVATGALFVHEMPYLLSLGIPAGNAALVIMTMTTVGNVGRLGFGWLSDVMDRRYVFAMTYALQFVGLIIWAFSRDFWQFLLFAVFFGPGYGGSIPVRPMLQSYFFGRKAFGTIQGAMLGITTVGGVFGPVFVGYMYDVSRNYPLAFLILAVALIPATGALFLLQKPVAQSHA